MHKVKRVSHKVVQVVAFLFISCVLLIWAWNNVMPELFSMPAIQFKQALGLMILMCLLSMFLSFGRWFGKNSYHSKTFSDENRM